MPRETQQANISMQALHPFYIKKSRSCASSIHVGVEIYFTAIYNAIDSTGNGDSVFILGWQFDPTLNIRTGAVVAPGSSNSIGALLATKRGPGR